MKDLSEVSFLNTFEPRKLNLRRKTKLRNHLSKMRFPSITKINLQNASNLRRGIHSTSITKVPLLITPKQYQDLPKVSQESHCESAFFPTCGKQIR